MEKLWLKEWLRHRGMTQEELEDASGVSIASISRIAKGKQNYSRELLERIAEGLGITSRALFEAPPQGLGGQTVKTLTRPVQKGEIVAEGRLIDVSELGSELSRPLLAAMDGRPKSEVWQLDSDKVAAAGYMPGDYLIVDPQAFQAARSIVLAEHNQKPIFRVYFPPYLFEIPVGPGPGTRLTVDNISIVIRGVVVAKFAISR